MAAFIPEAVEAVEGLASLAYNTLRADAISKVTEYGKRKLDRVEDLASEKIARVEDRMVVFGKNKFGGFGSWKRQKVLPASKTVSIRHARVGEPLAPNIPEPAHHIIRMQDERILASGSFRNNNFGRTTMPGRYRKSSRRRRKRKQYATKRGVKAMIGRYAHYSPFQKFSVSSGKYLGVSLTPTYGETYRGTQMFMTKTNVLSSGAGTVALDDMLASKPLPTVVDLGFVNAAKNYKYTFKKLRYHFQFHNPMNEVVTAKFWWLIANDDSTTNSEPELLWRNEYTEKSAALAPPTEAQFRADVNTYPTAYKEWKDRWSIVKTQKTVFQPGQTKEMFVKGRPFTWKEADQDLEYLKGSTMALMVELRGVPTHQNDGVGGATTNVNMSIVGLDFLWHQTYEIARSTHTSGLELEVNSRAPVTIGQSLQPENTATIASV